MLQGKENNAPVQIVAFDPLGNRRGKAKGWIDELLEADAKGKSGVVSVGFSGLEEVRINQSCLCCATADRECEG